MAPASKPRQSGDGTTPRRTGEMRDAAPAYPEPLRRLLAELERLPGVGKRSAERIAFHLLRSVDRHAVDLSRAIADVSSKVRRCEVCSGLADAERCSICGDPRRDHSSVLVVEQPKDLIALEQTGMYRGVYHVLMGRLSPLDGIGPEDLTIEGLLERVERPGANCDVAVGEVILGLNPTIEGDGTALYLAEQLHAREVRVSRLARGLPTGWNLEFANKAVLADALQGRQEMQ